MKKTLKWIFPVFVFGFVMLFSSNLQAQLAKNLDGDNMETAKDRYEQQHNVAINTDADFKATITPTQNNLQMWEEVLAGFSLKDQRGTPDVGFSNGAYVRPKPVLTLGGVQNVGSPEYQAVKNIIRSIKKGLGLPVGLN